MAQGDTLMNAVIGAVVSVVLSPLQFSPVLGGAVAGYLQTAETSEGVRIGAISGLLAALPIVLFLGVFGGIFLAVLPFTEGPGMLFGAASGLVILVVVVLTVLVSVGLSAAGGYLGAYLRREDVI
ncbi:MAG: DUF5518 domain-containing protein [Halobacteriaceae archaeon]